ncbi:putative transmembrane protein [Toxoplasma gondii VEG]|uniref:Transmembrane protein n=3 Tax=Toxoplasma gondii TaxID=5811 RepID=V4ZEU4_TOXGV|nr:putative transmembrane protein [Toxoplasma gondii VEG]KFG33032.1 putative transmembrane protein [Toxoplasma gondii p89]
MKTRSATPSLHASSCRRRAVCHLPCCHVGSDCSVLIGSSRLSCLSSASTVASITQPSLVVVPLPQSRPPSGSVGFALHTLETSVPQDSDSRMSRRSSPLSEAACPRERRRLRDPELESLSTCDEEHRNSLVWEMGVPGPSRPTSAQKPRRKSASAALTSLLASTDPRDHVYGTCPGGRSAVNAAVREFGRIEDARQAAYEASCLEDYGGKREETQRTRLSWLSSTLAFLGLACLYLTWLLDVQTETMLPVLGSIGQVLSMPSFVFHALLRLQRSLASQIAFTASDPPAGDAPAAHLFPHAAGEANDREISRHFAFLPEGSLSATSDQARETEPQENHMREQIVLKPWMPLIRQLDDWMETEFAEGAGEKEPGENPANPEAFLFRPRLQRGFQKDDFQREHLSAESQAASSGSREEGKRERKTDRREAIQEDWKAFADLQRSCAIPYHDGAFLIPEETPQNDPILQLPREMLLSSRDASAALRKSCRVPLDLPSSASSSSESRACSPNELLGLLLVREKQLQRELVRDTFLRVSQEDENLDEMRRRLPPLPFCLVKPTKNAFFFDKAHWEALELLSLLQKKPLDLFLADLTHAARETGVFGGDSEDSSGHRGRSSEDSDIRDAASILYSKGLWDLDDHVAVAPAGFELKGHFNRYSWNSDEATMHEAKEKSFSWKARGDLPSGSQILVNQGQLSNLHTLHRFGIVEESNSWGPVFLFRRIHDDDFEISPPFASFRHARGVAVPGELLFAHTPENMRKLPSWMLRKRVVPRDGTMCFHPEYRANPNAHYSCPPVANAGEATEEGNAEELPELDRPSTQESQTSTGQAGMVCEPSVFFNRTFGFGSLVLHRRGPIGGFDRVSYQCLRELVSSSLVASAREKPPPDGEAVEVEELEDTEGVSLATKEALTASLLKEACFLQLENTQQAVSLLKERQRQEEKAKEESREKGMALGRKAGEQNDSETQVTEMMLQAAKGDEELLQRCVQYFTALERRATVWERASAQF